MRAKGAGTSGRPGHVFAGILAAVVTIAGCAPVRAPALRVAAAATPGSGLLWLARDLGELRAGGAAVELVASANPGDAAGALASRRADVIVTTRAGLFAARAHRPVQAFDVLTLAPEIELLAADSVTLARRASELGRLVGACERARAWALAHPGEAARLLRADGEYAAGVGAAAWSADPIVPLANQWGYLGRHGRLPAMLLDGPAVPDPTAAADPSSLVTALALPPENTP